MSLHVPTETYKTLFGDSDQIPGVFRWNSSGSCQYGRGCSCCDVVYKHTCDKVISELLAKHDLSPTQAFLCTNDKFTVVQLEDYPEYFV